MGWFTRVIVRHVLCDHVHSWPVSSLHDRIYGIHPMIVVMGNQTTPHAVHKAPERRNGWLGSHWRIPGCSVQHRQLGRLPQFVCCAEALMPASIFRPDSSGPSRRSTLWVSQSRRLQGPGHGFRTRRGHTSRQCSVPCAYWAIPGMSAYAMARMEGMFPVTNLHSSEISSSFQPLWNGTDG